REIPQGAMNMMWALDLFFREGRQILVAGASDPLADDPCLNALRSVYQPNGFCLGFSPDNPDLPAHLPLLEGKTMKDDHITVYICEDRTCREPVTDADALAGLL
ncbi:MAG: hypothetical protein AAF492_18455, partial [Verrucomicrobiota bacterium]